MFEHFNVELMGIISKNFEHNAHRTEVFMNDLDILQNFGAAV